MKIRTTLTVICEWEPKPTDYSEGIIPPFEELVEMEEEYIDEDLEGFLDRAQIFRTTVEKQGD